MKLLMILFLLKLYACISIFRLLIYFNIFRIKIFYIDNIIKKVVCATFVLIYFIILLILYLYYEYKTCLIYYLCHELVINGFLDILSNNS